MATPVAFLHAKQVGFRAGSPDPEAPFSDGGYSLTI